MASAAVTRILVLGAVSLFQPVNGYQVLRELKSWSVEDWAEVRAGSIYSMLNSLCKQGLLVRHDLAEEDRAVAVYELSEAGREEFPDLVRRALDGAAGLNQVMFQVGWSFAPALPRSDVLTAMRRRLGSVAERRDALEVKITNDELPSHVRYGLGLDHRLAEAEHDWLAELVQLLEGGFLYFAGESGDPWQPPEDDAGWEMVDQAKRYRELIARQRQGES